MQKASQTALLQSINIQLLEIRNAELSYYIAYCTAFGTQAAFIVGFAYSGLTQIGIPPDIISPISVYNNIGFSITVHFFWVSTAVCVVTGMHCIMTTIFVRVMGPGLALHGPIGSMAKAAEGMDFELKPIFNMFIVMSVSSAVSVLFSCWILMTTSSAIASSIILVFSAYFWWKSCRRISARFRISRNKNVDIHFGPESISNSSSEGLSDMHHSSHTNRSPGCSSDYHREDKHDNDKLAKNSSVVARTMTDFLGSIFSGPAHHQNVLSTKARAKGTGSKHRMFQGYATVDEFAGSNKASHAIWSRRYFTLRRQHDLYFYESRQAFENFPGHPINRCPIDMRTYRVGSSSNQTATVCAKEDSSGSIQGASPLKTSPHVEECRAELRLVPEDKRERGWTLLLDTAEELELWSTALCKASLHD